MSLFKFKQFSVGQDQCAMKVGTDGVLLGAWASLEHKPNSILDVGTGTGLIALQMAQRSSAELIDAIEIDNKAYEQCVTNFEESPWSDRLFCYHAGFGEFVTEMDETYDLIVSNPPFHEEDVSAANAARDKARQSRALPFEELLSGVAKLLAPEGRFALIIPFKQEHRIVQIGEKYGLKVIRTTHVKGHPTSEIKRSLMEFSFKAIQQKQDELVIEKSRHVYTKEYVELTKSFYLKM